MPDITLPVPGSTPGPQWASDLNTAISAINGAVDLLIASGDRGGVFLYWAGGPWVGRPETENPVTWVSTTDPLAPSPTGMEPGDMWIRHPDALEPS